MASCRTKNVLIHQIENQTYEKTLLGQTNFERTLPDEIRADESFRIAIELKVGEFQPKFVGKMQFYLAALDATAREEGEEGEAPAISIILCKSKRRTIVEYALRDSNRPIGVGTYRVTRSLPKNMAGLLPTPEQVARLLEGWS